MAVAIGQNHGYKPFRSQRHKLESYTHLDSNFLELNQSNLANSLKKAFDDTNIHRSFSTPCLSLTSSVQEDLNCNTKIEILGGHGAPTVRDLVLEVAIAMVSGDDPTLLSNGLGGAYLFRSGNGNTIAVAKPVDEEPLAVNNPKGIGGRVLGQPGIKRSIRIGETGIRELAAYLLDHGGFAGVPPTALVKLSHPAFHVMDADAVSDVPCKIASLQRFVEHDYDSGELGPSGFSVASVHRIGILDVRLLNLDRHAGNMLVKKHDHDEYAMGSAELIPIDHGLCLPEWLDDPYFEWLHWPQAAVPFSESELEYISNLDPLKDAELLWTELPSLRESSIRVLIVCTTFLKRAATSGLCLAEIGEMMTREFSGGEETLSELEKICLEAKDSLPCISNESLGIEETQGEYGIFQLEDNGSYDCLHDISDVPQLLQIHAKVPRHQASKRSRFLSAESIEVTEVLMVPFCEENEDENTNKNVIMDNIENVDDSKDKCENHIEVGMTKGMSFSGQSHACEMGGISFEYMDAWEWKLFIETFENRLPELFEDRKCMRSKQKLGISRKF